MKTKEISLKVEELNQTQAYIKNMLYLMCGYIRTRDKWYHNISLFSIKDFVLAQRIVL